MNDKLNRRKAILFIHGILETPCFFEPFFPLVPADWAVYSVLLKGHNGIPKDFSAASMSQWKAQVRRAVERLTAKYDKVVIAAHSMGTLFAIQEAMKAPVTALFLMNVPLKIELKPILWKTVWSIYTDRIDPDDKITLSSKHSYGIEHDQNPLHYIGWIPRYFELFAEVRRTRLPAENFKVPAYAYFSQNDEMVSLKSAKYLKKNPRVIVDLLRTSWHHYYSPNDLRLMQRDFSNMMKRL